MKHLIMGTAGHIDHGKTALVKAISGIECDTHKQEKQRGITINLGFAHLSLDSGDAISIVDVPGHKDFIHTMVAGASGIDFVLLVVAADSGIMPQTREHLQIMEMLNISNGIIALTKTDTVDADIVELAQEEIAEFTQGTFLEKAPVLPVSSLTLDGIPKLISEIEKCVEKIAQRPRGEIFRLYIDRIFSVSGFGTVVTGSVISGQVKTGDQVYLLPVEKKLRVRRLERHGDEVEKIVAGDRASLNLVGLSREDFKRGMIVSDKTLQPTTMIDARLTLFPNARRISIWSDAVFLLGTYEAQVKVHLLDKNSAVGDEKILVQIHMPAPCIVSLGDRFVIRSTSGDISLGGGEVIDGQPLHHRRRPKKLIDNLQKIAEGKLTELVATEVRKQIGAISCEIVADRLNVSVADMLKIVKKGLPEDIMVTGEKNEMYFCTVLEYAKIKDIIRNNIKTYHKRNSMDKTGRTVRDLLSITNMTSVDGGSTFVKLILMQMVKENILKQVDNTWAIKSHIVFIPAEIEEKRKLISTFLKGFGVKVPLLIEIDAFAEKNDIEPQIKTFIIRQLIQENKVYKIENDFIHADIVNTIRTKLLNVLNETPDGLTVAQFRDLVADNRKICLLLYSLFDYEGYTTRKGNVRVITPKGVELISS